jgi:hypothetical protein
MEQTMKRTILPLAVAVIAVCVMASTARAGISGSKHDFGAFGWARNQICLPCHTPHNAIVRDIGGHAIAAPLWNHTLSSATYTLYVDPVNGTTTGNVDTNSHLCLSCHDGTVAVDSFGGGAGNQQLTGGLLGTDLSNDHPIGEAAVWPTPNPAYMVDPALRTAAGIMPLRQLSDGRNTVGCTSCHEPHNRKNQPNMLWVNNSGAMTTVDGRAVSGSGLCLNCHKK